MVFNSDQNVDAKAKSLTHSLMFQEAREAGTRISEQLVNNQSSVVALAEAIRKFQPHSVMIVGRGSSDHAGVFAKYLIEIETGVPTFAAAPSVATLYHRKLNLNGTLAIMISQSGRSPDILEQAKQTKASGALCVALLNDTSAPLAKIVDHVIPLSVGEEKSVAATKSYLATLSAILQIVAHWKQDKGLIEALATIPSALHAAVEAKAQLVFDDLQNIKNLVVLGRGLGYAISKEIALKLKEVCAIHAEAFSSAEFLHGPVTLVESHLKVLDVQVADESLAAHKSMILEIVNRGGDLTHLHQVTEDLHPRIAPLAVLQRFYLDIERIAVERGLNPDRPGGLKKVTETL